MKDEIRSLIDVSGMICLDDAESNISHAICRIRYTENDMGEFRYTFTPNYAEIDRLGEEAAECIPGLKLSRRQKRYIRSNRTPVFISERVPANNREDVRQLFLQDGMEGRSKLEWLMNTKTTYSGDSLVVRHLFPEEQEDESAFISIPIEESSECDDAFARDSSTAADGLAPRLKGFSRQGKGRPAKEIDPNLWAKVSRRYSDEEISAKEAAGMLEISESTFFRRLRDVKREADNNENVSSTKAKAKGRYANRSEPSNVFGARSEAARAEIEKLDGAEFQRLCARYVRDRYGLDGLTAPGMKAGAYTTTRGTPDAFWEYPDGSFLAMEAGHYSSSKSAAKNKIIDDIQKCIDYEKVHLNAGSMRRIVICYSCNRFAMEDRQAIRNAFPDREIDLVGPDELAAAVTEDFPWIGREILSIPYKSHAVMTISDFVDLHASAPYRAPLDFDLAGREDEKEQILNLIEENQVVVIQGDSGAGKTRLAIDVVQEYGQGVHTLPVVVNATKEDVSEELILCCKKDQEHIILLDDANEISRLSFLPGFLRENSNVKVVATVRSYAFETVREEFKDIGMSVFRLDRLFGDELDAALENSFGISSAPMRKALEDQSRGNLRLAYFIQRAYAEGIPEGTCFGDILKECYSLATEWLSENEKNAIRVSSILGAHCTFDNEDLETLLECVGMTLQTYKQACEKLCENELMDSVQGVRAVSFEEQNLRDYFIYEGLMSSQIFSLETIWGLTRGDRLLLNCVNILLQVFPEDATFDFVKGQLSSIWESASFGQRKDLVKKYHTLLGAKGLRFLIDQAGSLPPIGQDISAYKAIIKEGSSSVDSWALGPLSRYVLDSQYHDSALETLVALIDNDALKATDVGWLFAEGLELVHPSGRVHYEFERGLFNRFLDAYANTGNEVLAFCAVLLAKRALKDEVEWTESDGGKTFTLRTATLQANDAVFECRRRVLEALRELCVQTTLRREILEVAFGYSAAHRAESNDLFAATAGIIVELFSEFVSDDDLLSLESAAMFRHRCSFYGLGDLAERLLREIGSSTKAEFILSLIDERRRLGEQDECSASLELASRFDESDWREIAEAFSKEETRSKFGSDMYGFMQRYIATEQDPSKLDMLCDLMLLSGSYPYGGNAFCESLLRRWGTEQGREGIIESHGSYIGAWLQNYDEYCIIEGHVLSDEKDYMSGWNKYGVILPLSEILAVEAKHKGFLHRYFEELADADCANHPMLWLVLPHNEEMMKKLKPFMEAPEVLSSVKALALEHFEKDGWIDKSLAEYLFDCDRAFIVELMKIDVRIREEDALMQLASKFWLDHTAEDLESIGALIEDASRDFKNYYSCREWLKLFLVAASECGKSGEALVWLRSLECGICSKYGMWAEIVCSLGDESKIQYITSICEENIERDLFTYIAFSMSFEGKSWSGSESSIVMQDIEFANKLKKALKDRGLYKYTLECDEYIEYCNKRLQGIEIEDFIDDW